MGINTGSPRQSSTILPESGRHAIIQSYSSKDVFSGIDSTTNNQDRIKTINLARINIDPNKKPQNIRHKKSVFQYVSINKDQDTKSKEMHASSPMLKLPINIPHIGDKFGSVTNLLRATGGILSIKKGTSSTPSLVNNNSGTGENTAKASTPILHGGSPYDSLRAYGQVSGIHKCKQVFSSIAHQDNHRTSTFKSNANGSSPSHSKDKDRFQLRRSSTNSVIDILKERSPTRNESKRNEMRGFAEEAKFVQSRKLHRHDTQKNIKEGLQPNSTSNLASPVHKTRNESIKSPTFQNSSQRVVTAQTTKNRYSSSPDLKLIKPGLKSSAIQNKVVFKKSSLKLAFPMEAHKGTIKGVMTSKHSKKKDSGEDVQQEPQKKLIIRTLNLHSGTPTKLSVKREESSPTAAKKDNADDAERPSSPKKKQTVKPVDPTVKEDRIEEAVLWRRAKDREIAGVNLDKAVGRSSVVSASEKKRVWKGENGVFRKDLLAQWYKHIDKNIA